MYEQHGWPEIVGAMVSGILIFGGLICLCGVVWAWAIGSNLVYGVVIGGIVGGVLGSLQGLMAGSGRSRSSRRAAAGGCGMMVGPPVFLVLVVGVIVGLIRISG
jgi:hypothetical protein